MTEKIQQNMIKNGLILAAFAIVTTGLIALTYFGTKDQIALQQQQKLLSILNAVIDKSSYDNTIQLDCALVTSANFLGSDEPQHIYRATKHGEAVSSGHRNHCSRWLQRQNPIGSGHHHLPSWLGHSNRCKSTRTQGNTWLR